MKEITPLEATCDCNVIKDTICKIDKLQKDAVANTLSDRCITCETSLFTNAYNTIPITLNTCCGNMITGRYNLDGNPSQYFRVENIRCKRFVTLRILALENTNEDPNQPNQNLYGTNYTMIVDLDCVGSVQCFEPINVEICSQSIEKD